MLAWYLWDAAEGLWAEGRDVRACGSAAYEGRPEAVYGFGAYARELVSVRLYLRFVLRCAVFLELWRGVGVVCRLPCTYAPSCLPKS